MEQPYRRIGSIAAKVYVVLVLLCGLAFLALAYIFFGAGHAGEAAPFFLVPGLIFVVLSVFIWRGAMWAMLLLAALAFGLVFIVVHDDKSFLAWLAVPVVFAALTAIGIVCKMKSRTT